MIKIHDSKGREYTFDHTKFPDGTSQAWKVDPEIEERELYTVTWLFENEAEFITVLQLGELFCTVPSVPATLNVPFLPYGRQDKEVSNHTTFARQVFIDVLYYKYGKITTYDAHSSSPWVISQEPRELIEATLPKYDAICFPDKGAKDRYSKLLNEVSPGMTVLYCDKVRNQQTGEIEGLELQGTYDSFFVNSILVWDDLIDAGRTFIEVAKVLKPHCKELGLAVSHGLFTKGLDIIYDSGYNHIYTTNSLLRNTLPEDKYENSGKYYGLFGLREDKFLTVVKVV